MVEATSEQIDTTQKKPKRQLQDLEEAVAPKQMVLTSFTGTTVMNPMAADAGE